MRQSITNPEYSSTQIADEFNNINPDANKTISAAMVRKILFKRGLKSYCSRKKPFLSRRMRKQRIEFCKKYSHLSALDWSSFIFSDESYIEINLNSMMNRVRRFPTENPFSPRFTTKTVKHPLKIMIWGCFNRRGPGRIYACEGTMNSNHYLNVMESKLLPTINDYGLGGNVYHLDDSARPHRSKKIIDWHKENNIKKIEWPGNSPDLNPIENLWAILKRKLRSKRSTTKRELLSNILKVWHNEIPEEVFKNLSDSMPNRIKKVLENKGNSTKY